MLENYFGCFHLHNGEVLEKILSVGNRVHVDCLVFCFLSPYFYSSGNLARELTAAGFRDSLSLVVGLSYNIF